jgi:hypothetical protein
MFMGDKMDFLCKLGKRPEIFAIFFLLCASITTVAQVEQGRFVGKVTDSSGAAVVGASVVSRNVDTNIEQRTISNDTGEYVITPVPVGVYALTFTASGFQTTVTGRIEVQVGQIVRRDVSLGVGGATTTVEVDATAPLLATDSATLSQVLTNKEVTDMPLNGRGYYRLAQLTPGAVLLGATGNTLPIRPETVNGNVISGIRGSATSFLLDGVDTSEQHQGGTFIQTSVDAIQEIGVTQSPYSAEFNRGGAFFNSTTKSGTNDFHGGVFEYIRNDYLDARNYFALTRQRLKRNQFGATLGGPITLPHLYNGKNRTFFFFNYEGLRLRQTVVYNSTVPSDNARSGIFTGYKKIYDPLSNTNPQLRTEFPNDVIPSNRLSAQALAILNFYPHQNTQTGTYQRNAAQPINFDQYIGRIDNQLTQNNRLFARWVYMKQSETDPNFSPLLGVSPLTSLGQDIAVGLISNLRPTMINEIRSHYLPSHVRLPAFLQGPDWNGRFGVTGFSDLLRDGTSAFPDYAWSNYASLQGSSFDQRPKSQDRKAWEITDNVTILHGKHSVKFGTLIRYYQWLGYDSQQFAGSFTFNGNQTTRQVQSGGTLTTTGGDSFADFLLGYPSAVQRAYPADNFGGQGWSRQFFVQDDFRMNDRVTINMGLRYEYTPWLTGYKGQAGTFDPTQSKPIIVGSYGATPDLSGQASAPRAYEIFQNFIQTSSTAKLPYNMTYTDKRQFGPRVGISVSLTKKTVVRSGFGIFYEPEGTSGRLNLNMLPYRLNETQNQTQNALPTRTLANYFMGVPLSSPSANPSLVPTRTHLSMGQNIHFSLDIEHQFNNHDVFDVGYVGNRGVHQNSTTDFNDPAPAAGTIQTRRPYPQWGTITFNSQDLSHNYSSLQTKFNHRFSHSFSMLASYTFSKLMSYGPVAAVGGNNGFEYALSSFDVPHVVALSSSYAVPGTFLAKSNRFFNTVLGGWQLQSIIVLRSPTPFTLSINGDRANTGVGGQRPNLNPGGCGSDFKRSITTWFDRRCYVDAPLYQYGTIRANTLRADVGRQIDGSLFKNFTLPHEHTLSFRLEAFNIPNLVTFAAPSSNIDSATGGQITGQGNSPRNIQLALKYKF